MTVRPIVQAQGGIDILRKVSSPVGGMTDALQSLIVDMIDTMNKHNALGLSAIQINVPVRIIVISRRTGCMFPVMINPVILEVNQKTVFEREGCLSIDYGKPEFTVQRAKTIRMWAYDRRGNEMHLDVAGRAARVIQHEIDHLDGKLISDYATLLRA